MGDSRADNGGSWPPDDGGHDLPELPPEWHFVIPDDPAELAAEAHAVRRELRREARRTRLRTRFRFPPRRRDHEPGRSLAVPIVIMMVAILTTLISLFAVTWGRAPMAPNIVASQPQRGISSRLVDATVRDSAGREVRLGGLLPAIVLLVDGCDCKGLIQQVSARAPNGVKVLAVGANIPPVPTPTPENVVPLTDPESVLRVRASAPPNGAAVALLISRSGDVVATVPNVHDATNLPPIDPAQLA